MGGYPTTDCQETSPEITSLRFPLPHSVEIGSHMQKNKKEDRGIDRSKIMFKVNA